MKFNRYLPIAVAALLITANPAFAQLQSTGLETITIDIWDFMIQNVGLLVVGMAVIGALIGAMISNPGQGIGRALVGLAIGATLGAVPAMSTYVLSFAA